MEGNYDFMNINETSLDLFDYSVRIMGESGVGKTSLYKELMESFSEQTGNKYIGILLPLEQGYHQLNGINVFKLKDPITGVVKNSLDDYSDVKKAVDQLVSIKKSNPDFPVKIVGIDTTTRLEKYLEKEVESRHFNEVGVYKKFNECWKGYGTPHKVMKAILMEEVIDKLRSAGFLPYYISHSRIKQKKTKATQEEYMYIGADTGDGFDNVVLQDCDMSLVYAVERKIVNKQEVIGDRTIKLRNDEEYKGAKSRFSYVPEEFIAGKSAKETAEIFVDIFKKAVRVESGIEDDNKFEEKKTEQVEAAKIVEAEALENMKKQDALVLENESREKFVLYLQGVIMTLAAEWIGYLNQLSSTNQKADIYDYIRTMPIENVKELATSLQYTM